LLADAGEPEQESATAEPDDVFEALMAESAASDLTADDVVLDQAAAELDAMLGDVTEEAEQALAEEIGGELESEEEQAVALDQVPEPAFGVDAGVVEDVAPVDDADELLDQLMSEIEEVTAEAPVVNEDAPEVVPAPGELAEAEMSELISSDLGDLDALLDDPLEDSSVAAPAAEGLDDLLEQMSSQTEDVLDAGVEVTADVLTEVELDSADLDAQIDSDLDDMLASLEQDIANEGGNDLASLEAGQVPSDEGADLEAQIDDELDTLLNAADVDIEMEEVDAVLQEPDLSAEMATFDGVDEVETKLDLARAYMEMDDLGGARDILNEVKQEGSARQAGEADKLLNEMPA